MYICNECWHIEFIFMVVVVCNSKERQSWPTLLQHKNSSSFPKCPFSNPDSDDEQAQPQAETVRRRKDTRQELDAASIAALFCSLCIKFMSCKYV